MLQIFTKVHRKQKGQEKETSPCTICKYKASINVVKAMHLIYKCGLSTVASQCSTETTTANVQLTIIAVICESIRIQSVDISCSSQLPIYKSQQRKLGFFRPLTRVSHQSVFWCFPVYFFLP